MERIKRVREEAKKKLRSPRSPSVEQEFLSPSSLPENTPELCELRDEVAELREQKAELDREVETALSQRAAADLEIEALRAELTATQRKLQRLKSQGKDTQQAPAVPSQSSGSAPHIECDGCRKLAAKAAYMRGMELSQRHKTDQAIEEYLKALQIDPTHRQAADTLHCTLNKRVCRRIGRWVCS